jgi:hypothetical protein
MNNSELDAILKRARAPERSEEFFETFPHQVARQLKRTGQQGLPVGPRWFPRLAWGLATAVCVLIGFAIGHWCGRTGAEALESKDVLQNAKFVQETLAMFPNQVCAIMHDQHGLNLVLSNRGDVPASPPIYVRVCDGKNCSSCVTFSGQEVQIAGQELTILSDAAGGVIVTGRRFVWSSNLPHSTGGNLKIETKSLNLTTL